jgi:hypothetical protein
MTPAEGSSTMQAFRLALGLALAAVVTSAACADEDVPEERIIEQKLDTTQSQVLRQSSRPLERLQVERDLGAAELRLRSYKTMQPNAEPTPLLERKLDRLSRPTGRGPRGPVPLLGEH